MAHFVKHVQCNACGSSDGRALYSDDGEYCWVCNDMKVGSEMKSELDFKNNRASRVKSFNSKKEDMEIKPSNKPALTEEENAEIKSFTSIKANGFRSINDETYRAFGVRHAFDAETGEVVEQYYPVTQDGQISGYKIREVPKNFRSKGRTGADCELFMQFKFNRGGKYVLICEGEVDSLSAYQMLADYNKSRGSDYETAVVSPTTGAQSKKQIAAQYKFLDSFEQIILCFDNDKAGQDAVEDVLKYLPKGKAKVMSMRYKDANEYLKNGKQKEFIQDFYGAKKFVPTGVLPSDQLYDRIINQTQIQKVPFPPFMGKLNEMFVGGMPLGHIVNIAADTGLGKCFAKGTKIRMYDMTVKEVQDIRNGDVVMGDDGTPRTVTGCTSGTDTMYRITQKNAMSYVVNSAHILSLRAGTKIKTLNLEKNDILNINVEDYLKLYPTHQKKLKGYQADISNYGNGEIDHAYLIGLWLGDGTSSKSQITFGKSENELLNWFYDYCEQMNWNTNISPSNDREGCVTIDIPDFRKVLKEYSLLNNKHIPLKIMQSNLETRLEVLAGILDADGYVNDNCISTTMKNTSLVHDMVTLARSVGLHVNVNDKVFKKCQNFEGDYYVNVVISGNTDKIPMKLSKRKCNPRKQIKNALNTGIVVEKLEVGEYFGFQVDGNHLFCLEDFTVTHNTTLVNSMIEYWIFNSPHTVGIVSMELDAGQYGEALLSQYIRRKLALIASNDEKMEVLKSESIKKKADELFKKEDGDARFYLLDNRDGTVEEIQDAVEELVVSCGAKIIVLDPLQDILDGLTNEEQAVFLKWAKGFIKSHGITFVFINHMRKTPAGQSGADSEQNIMGSSTIIKSASANILLKRDKMAEDPVVRNTTELMVTKNRVCGITGPAGAIYYDNETHNLYNLDDWLNGNIR